MALRAGSRLAGHGPVNLPPVVRLLVGDYTHDRQPAKFAAIEARWRDESPASETVIAWLGEKGESNWLAIDIPYLGSLIASSPFG